MSTLFAFSAGSKVKVHHYEEGFPLQRRLSALGLIPGEEVVILRNDGICPIIVSVKGARFMLGRSVCRSIYAVRSDAQDIVA